MKRGVYNAYLFSREGRYKFAESMISPIRTRSEYYRKILDTRSHPLDWTWTGVLEGIKGAIIEYENFLNILPDDERFTHPVCEMRKSLGFLYSMYDEAKKACEGLDRNEVHPGTAVPRT